MPKIKSHKTVEQIAKKHRLDVSFIQRQLDMGEPIEHEHTRDHELAMDIALQHLDEIPDYYTRLKKMEADAKKHHKKFKDVKEQSTSSGSLNYEWEYPVNTEKIRYCPKCKKDETREDCQYGTRYWDMFSLPSKLKEENKSGDSNLRDWFKKSSGKDPKTGRKVSGWVQLGGPFAGAPCARQPGQTSTPKCGSSKMAANLSPEEEDEAFRRKNRKDPNQPQKRNAAKPTNVRTEEMDLQEKKKEGKKDACYNKVKSRYDVWPSAYASGALVKCRKVGAANWGNTTKESHMHEEERYCPLCDKRETRSECSYGTKAWDKVSVKDEEYSMARGELQTIVSAVKRLQDKLSKGEGDLEAWVQSKITKAADYIDTAADYLDSGEHKFDEACWSGYKQIGMKKKGKRKVPNCVPEEKKLVDKILEDCGCSHSPKKVKSKKVVMPEQTIEDLDGNTFAEVIDIIKPESIKGTATKPVQEATRMQAQTGNVIAVTLSWRGKYYSMKMFFPQVKTPTRKEINDELQKVYPGSVVIYHSVSEIQPGQPLIQMCGPQGGSPAKPGPSKAYVKAYGEQVEFEEDWQKVNRQDKTNGLSQKAVDAYRKENPGSNLQTAVTEKNPTGKRAQRRKNFCSRMKGMKDELTSAETARDPDSRINKALRRWNCN